jgi:hypothetical protein
VQDDPLLQIVQQFAMQHVVPPAMKQAHDRVRGLVGALLRSCQLALENLAGVRRRSARGGGGFAHRGY